MVTAQIKEHTVFVGNIPYGLTEEQIVHVLSQAGQVLNFRLVYDKDTGRPRGYGFAEFSDNDAAASAVRNLNNYETMGRHLRVDWSNDGPSKEERPGQSSGQADGSAQNVNGAVPAQNQSNILPPLPQGADLPPGVTCPDAISNTLRSIYPPQLLDTLSQMKNLVDTAPGAATGVLERAPQLSYALFQALLLLGLVDTQTLGQVVQQASNQSQPQPPPVQVPPQNFQQPQPPPQQPPMPQFQQAPQFQQMQTATPPMGQPQYQPPNPGAAGGGNQNQQAVIQQILSMSQEAIDQLAPDQRNNVMIIRQRFQQGLL